MEQDRQVRDPEPEEGWAVEAEEVEWEDRAWDQVGSVYVPVAAPGLITKLGSHVSKWLVLNAALKW